MYSGGKLMSFSTTAVACGFFTELMYETDRQRWLKKARYAGTDLNIHCVSMYKYACPCVTYAQEIQVAISLKNNWKKGSSIQIKAGLSLKNSLNGTSIKQWFGRKCEWWNLI